ncbi:MAG TPA: LUD domain-containing protein [Actinospica sp.]|nr:LUD domain-containing protein [Actinospica sp.]
MTTTDRDRILGRIRAAVAGAPEPAPVARDYATVHHPGTPDELVDLLAENLTDYRAHVHRADPDNVAGLVARLVGGESVTVPHDLPAEWISALTTAAVVDEPLSDAVITGCALAIAETGTIVLDAGPGQGRRALTLVPDHHVCVVRVPEQLVASLPTALPRLDPGRPLTWISGPSATSDIELDRVEGVHGPRTLDVILLVSGSRPR